MAEGEPVQCRVAVAILNWNGEPHLRRFLHTVVAHCEEPDRVVLIDNGSTDGSLAFVRESAPHVEVIALPENLGFAGGYNAGIKLLQARLQAEWVLLLNSDVEVTKGWVGQMVDACDRHGWTAAQPKIRSLERRAEFEYAGAAGGYMDRHGFMFCAGRIFDECELDAGQYDDERSIFWASGAALMVRFSAWNSIQGLDEDFFAHMEEIDLCWRLRNRGHSIGVATATHVYHLGGGTLSHDHPRKTQLNFRNNLYLLLKNDHRSGIRWRIFVRQLLDGMAGVRLLLSGKPAHCMAVIRAHVEFRSNRSLMRGKRAEEQKTCVSLERSSMAGSGFYSGSIIADFFFRGRRKWSALPRSRFH